MQRVKSMGEGPVQQIMAALDDMRRKSQMEPL